MLHPKPNLIFNLPKSSPFKKIYLCETIQIQFPLKPKRRSCSLNIPLGSILANWFSMYTALGRGGEVGDQIIDSFQIRKYEKWKSSFTLRTARGNYLYPESRITTIAIKDGGEELSKNDGPSRCPSGWSSKEGPCHREQISPFKWNTKKGTKKNPEKDSLVFSRSICHFLFGCISVSHGNWHEHLMLMQIHWATPILSWQENYSSDSVLCNCNLFPIR